MSNSPESKKERKIKSLSDLMDNNKFVLLISIIIAFIVWVMVAMYKSPEESYTIYNVPITIDTNNSIVSQKGYVNFWQSDEKIDVTVTGPRYMITSLTADDIVVSANLNTVDSAGIAELTLKVNLKENSQDITISSMSKTSIEVYFDAELEKSFDVEIDQDIIPDHIAEGFESDGAELTVTSVKLKGPETEINKIVNVVADPEFPEELLYETSTLPVTLNLEGATAADTVSVNKYVTIVDVQEYFVKVNVNKILQLIPTVEFNGIKSGNVETTVDVQLVNAKLNTAFEYDSKTLTVMKVDYSALSDGENTYTVKLSDVTLPEGLTVTSDVSQFNIVITKS